MDHSTHITIIFVFSLVAYTPRCLLYCITRGQWSTKRGGLNWRCGCSYRVLTILTQLTIPFLLVTIILI